MVILMTQGPAILGRKSSPLDIGPIHGSGASLEAKAEEEGDVLSRRLMQDSTLVLSPKSKEHYLKVLQEANAGTRAKAGLDATTGQATETAAAARGVGDQEAYSSSSLEGDSADADEVEQPEDALEPEPEGLVQPEDAEQQLQQPRIALKGKAAGAGLSEDAVEEEEGRVVMKLEATEGRKMKLTRVSRNSDAVDSVEIKTVATLPPPPPPPLTSMLLGQKDPDSELTPLEIAANQAWAAGKLAWDEADADIERINREMRGMRLGEGGGQQSSSAACVQALLKHADEVAESKNMVYLPCGMTVGSAITVVGRVLNPTTVKETGGFHVELQGLRVVDGEDPPRIYHFNPRLSGDWSGRSVIEQNTCYRSQWGVAQRCEGYGSKEEEEKVDGQRRCEKWSRLDHTLKDTEKNSGWLQRLIHRTNKELLEWPFPFEKGRIAIITIRAGWEGFHVVVDGNHVTSFPYRTGYIVEEATGVHIGGDIQVDAVFATSLPSSPPARHAVLESSDKLKAPALKEGAVKMFIGILSASNHFEERLAVRKTWLQYPMVRTGDVIARFFVAMHPSKQVNVEVRKEAELYGDMVILPFIDRYDLVVLKTIAILEYGVRNVTTKYIMKADDDNFVRLGTVLHEIEKVGWRHGLYMGNINEFHKPLREGKWAVTEEEWPETNYPPYANGPGYIVTRDIAEFVANMHEQDRLRIFKMEDVSMGMWVVQYAAANHTVHYVHDWKYVQFGCLEDYITAHYQSPRQMVCMWGKLSHGEAKCCNQR
eukprot:jgi/Mesen1/10920/ME000095S10257